jgi:hypothetical protein
MKRIFYAAFIMLPGLLFAQAQTFYANMDIRGRDCNGGLGICTPVSISNSQLTGLKAIASKVSSNQMLITITNASLATNEQLSLYGKLLTSVSPSDELYLKLESDMVIDDNSLKSIDIDVVNNTIPAGDYILTIVNGTTRILFDLKPGQ